MRVYQSQSLLKSGHFRADVPGQLGIFLGLSGSQSLLKSGHFRGRVYQKRTFDRRSTGRNPFLNQVIFEGILRKKKWREGGKSRNPFLNQVIFEKKKCGEIISAS